MTAESPIFDMPLIPVPQGFSPNILYSLAKPPPPLGYTYTGLVTLRWDILADVRPL